MNTSLIHVAKETVASLIQECGVVHVGKDLNGVDPAIYVELEEWPLFADSLPSRVAGVPVYYRET